MMEYQACVEFDMSVGDEVCIVDTKWYCLEQCTLLGWTKHTDGWIPVVKGRNGSEAALTQFIQASQCASLPRADCVRIENVTLVQYRQIKPDDLMARDIVAAKYSSDFYILITADKCYVKIGVGMGYEDCSELRLEPLNLIDLKTMNLISDATWETYQREQEDRRKGLHESFQVQAVMKAARELREKRVRKILGGHHEDV